MHLGSLAAMLFGLQDAPAIASPGNDAIWLWIALGVGALALVAALVLAKIVLSHDTGTAEMRVISDAIKEGAEAFLARQYRTIGIMAVILAVAVYLGYHASPRTAPVALKTVIAFLVGAICSGLAGFTGMYVSIRANIRTASAARTSLNKALQAALRGGAVTGLVVVALSLLGVGALFLFFGGLTHPQEVPTSSSASASVPHWSRSSRSSAAASTPRLPTSARTSSARSKPASPRTIRATRPSSPTWSATTWATAPAAARTSSSPPQRRTSAP
jgi:hypothetical protein